MSNYNPRVGARYNQWTLIRRVNTDKWEARCTCGTAREVWVFGLLRGRSKSCGCATFCAANRRTQPGEYTTWRSMNNRCRYPSDGGYARYGGRGITVCDRWRKFQNFFDDMGPRPLGTSIDRIDNAKGYTPDNCRWSTWQEQMANRRPKKSKIMLTYCGKTRSISDWVRVKNLSFSTIYSRWRLNWSVPRIFSTPVHPHQRKHK